MDIRHLLKQKLPANLRNRLSTITHTAKALHLKPYLVGGVVRDILLSLPVKKDLDITVEGGGIQPLVTLLKKKWHADEVSYPQFLTFTLHLPDKSHIDLITTRSETYFHPAALPKVTKGSLSDDLSRRDFSINAMAISIAEDNWGELRDLFGGLSDLHKKQIKILHPKSFEDDPTRIFRAARFAGRFSFHLEKETESFLKVSVKNQDVKKLSSDRIRNELEKLLTEENPSPALNLLSDWKVMEQVHHLLKWRMGTAEEKMFDSLSQTISDKDALKVVRLAFCLKHCSLESSTQVLEKFNFSKSFREKTLDLLSLYNDISGQAKITSLPDRKLTDVHFLFIKSLQTIMRNLKLERRWQEYQRWIRSSPQIDGSDLKEIGFKPGPIYRKILHSLRLAKFRGKVKTKQEEVKFVKGCSDRNF